MSEKVTAFYYLDNYYLVPQNYSGFDGFYSSLTDLPITVKTIILLTDCHIGGNIQKGISIAPYFISDYGFPEVQITIEDASDVFSVEAEIMTQIEYNERIRKVITDYCPGCLRYKPISNRVQSLNGHFEEISLDSVCFFRQNSKPAPRVFRECLYSFGGFAYHFHPENRSADELLNELKTRTYTKLTDGRFADDGLTYTVSFPRDYITQTLVETVSDYIRKHLYFSGLKLVHDSNEKYGADDFEKSISPAGSEKLRKDCKRYGIAPAVLNYDTGFSDKIRSSLEILFENDYAKPVFVCENKMYLFLLDRSTFMKELHFRFPLLERASAYIDVFNGESTKRYTLSKDLKVSEI